MVDKLPMKKHLSEANVQCMENLVHVLLLMYKYNVKLVPCIHTDTDLNICKMYLEYPKAVFLVLSTFP